MDRLRAMELFLSVSQTRSFSETARLFGISATAVSRMITEFEDGLQVKLLLRSTRQVSLTESGQEYAAQLEGILWTINQAHTNITAISSAPQGRLRVHARTMFGQRVLPGLIARFRQTHPEILVELLLSETKVDLVKNNIDIDFRISPPVEAGVKRRMLFHSQRYLVASPAYVDKMPAIHKPVDLLQAQCLAYYLPGKDHIWHFKNDAGVEDIRFSPRHLTNNGIALLELAKLGEGIALLDDYTVYPDLAEGNLVRLLPDYVVSNTTFEEGMFATIVDSAIIPAKVKLFLDFVASQVAGEAQRFALPAANAPH
ncbi:MAG: LysR family transcriptional regulator [Comamonas sp.]|jgi:DNA-binding transcriptional LysR family regulator|nr:LysR family transcriptional regulator [Comamonas sp.]